MRELIDYWNWGMVWILLAGLVIGGLYSLVRLIITYHVIGYVLLGASGLVLIPMLIGYLMDEYNL